MITMRRGTFKKKKDNNAILVQITLAVWCHLRGPFRSVIGLVSYVSMCVPSSVVRVYTCRSPAEESFVYTRSTKVDYDLAHDRATAAERHCVDSSEICLETGRQD